MSPTDPTDPTNGTPLFDRLLRLAAARPDAVALVRGRRDGSGRPVTFARLAAGCLRTAEALREAGVAPGQRAVVMTRNPDELTAVVYALMLIGAVPLLVDPGLPRRDLCVCLDEAAPEVFVGEPLAHLARRVLGWARGHVRVPVTTGRRLAALDDALAGRLPPPAEPPDAGPAARAPADADLAVIAFTSGSTGVPKGVEYRYATLAGQLDALATVLVPREPTVLLSGFLPFVLFGPALGVTTVAPAVNHRAPIRTPPERILRPLLEHRATVLAASPAMLRLLAEHCARRGLTLPSVDRVVSFGAPLHAGTGGRLRAVLRPDAELLSVYGATECLPVSAVNVADLDEPGPAGGAAGTCLGPPLPGLRVRVLDADRGGVGEVAVAGPNVSPAYHARPEANAAAKLTTKGGLLHRTGDMGRLDDLGRLWFHGRRAHQVRGAGFTLNTEDVEAAAGRVPGVRRAALVGVGAPGRQRAVLCAELAGARRDRPGVLDALRGVLADHPEGRRVETVLVHPRLPTDIRHNAKIDRERLAAWAAPRLRGRP
ncbi:AMP-binding protein [Streptomyces sp. B6B3]|uniref:AMP-binding protein n=1 Tax=Streptomyces sp. B6B3 TaxID=3153570 RepID=UPI00325E561B